MITLLKEIGLANLLLSVVCALFIGAVLGLSIRHDRELDQLTQKVDRVYTLDSLALELHLQKYPDRGAR